MNESRSRRPVDAADGSAVAPSGAARKPREGGVRAAVHAAVRREAAARRRDVFIGFGIGLFCAAVGLLNVLAARLGDEEMNGAGAIVAAPISGLVAFVPWFLIELMIPGPSRRAARLRGYLLSFVVLLGAGFFAGLLASAR
jgi:hypothetical protein